MKSVLGIDAAWTVKNPSGVALIRQNQGGRWQCVAVTPSYEAFTQKAECKSVDWDGKPSGGTPNVERLLGAAQKLLDEPVTIVSVDMPLSRKPVKNRRECDQCISKRYGSRKCGTHSPTPTRPGEISADLSNGLEARGYKLAVKCSDPSIENAGDPATIEVYPHTALLYLLDLNCRLPYKVAKTRKYWPGKSIDARKKTLVTNFGRIATGLKNHVDEIPNCCLPPFPYNGSLNFLKRYEDALVVSQS
jgi:predicted RNase H-like nuclease